MSCLYTNADCLTNKMPELKLHVKNSKPKIIGTRCCTLRRAKNTPTRSCVSNLYISQHSLPENAVETLTILKSHGKQEVDVQ